MSVNYASIFTTILATTCIALATSGCKDPNPSERSLPSSAQSGDASNCLADEEVALTNTSWNSGISTIFQNNCAGGCHPGSQTTDYSTFAGVSANLQTILTKIQSGSMPKGKTMTQADKDAVSQWVSAGNPQNDGGGSTTASTPPPASTNCTSNGAQQTASPGATPTVSPGASPTASPTATPTPVH